MNSRLTSQSRQGFSPWKLVSDAEVRVLHPLIAKGDNAASVSQLRAQHRAGNKYHFSFESMAGSVASSMSQI